MGKWNPDGYLTFASERFAPFEDLAALVRQPRGGTVIDLGCGTGELTARLADHLPGADVLGIDASPAMLEKASRLGRPGLRFERKEIEAVEGRFDVIFSNAALQWVGGHRALFARLFSMLEPDGQIVVQMPAQRRPNAYAAIAETARTEPFRTALAGYEQHWPVLEIEDYALLLQGLGACDISAFDKVYLHLLADADALVDWQAGTALLPYRERLAPQEYADFEGAVRARLRGRWPQTPVALPFRRTLIAATRPA